MKVSKPIKVVIGLLTLWELILPVVFVVTWFSFVFSAAWVGNQPQPGNETLLIIFFLIFPLLFLSSFLLVLLNGYLIIHVILNKTGADAWRSVLGVGLMFFPYLAAPVYYLIYILPENPPAWALAKPQVPLGSA